VAAAEACAAWAARKTAPLAELLLERGWLSAADRDEVERVLQRRIDKHRGDVKVSLAHTVDSVRPPGGRSGEVDGMKRPVPVKYS